MQASDFNPRMEERAGRRKAARLNLLLLTVLCALALLALCVGKYPVSPWEALGILFGGGAKDAMANSVVWGLRLPRILGAVFCGAALALSGAAYQGVFKNPLVSPDFLGVSQGACVGAALAILLALPAGMTQLFAFLGGILAVGLTLVIPSLIRNQSNLMLVLSGIIVGGLMGSLMGFIKYIADPETQLAAITYWQMGSFSYVDLEGFFSVLPAMVLSGACLFGLSWWIDVMSLGEREAQTLGTNVVLVRTLTVVCATFLTASSVCLAGTIGWVGLVIPHFGRMMVGTSNIRLLPAACLVGGIFLLVVDAAARTIGTTELPISILTGMVGAPFYAWLLYRRRMTVQ